MPKTAISFRVPDRLWEAFKTQTDNLFIARAPFLNHMVKQELPHLREDLAGLRLSTRAKRHISGELKRLGAKSRNIEVEPETAEALRAVVAEHNIVRDAFMCRLIIFLRSTNALLKYLELPHYATDRGIPSMLEEMPSSPLGAMEAVRDDPLFYIRNHLHHVHECGVYRVQLPREVSWAACYLEDEFVEGTRAFRKQKKLTDAAFALLDLPAGRSASPTRKTSRSSK